MDRRKVSVEELEAMIAEFVMELDVREVVQRSVTGHGNIDETIVWVVSNGEDYEDSPRYARDANATRQLIDKLRSEGYQYMFWDEDGGTKVAEFLRHNALPHQAAGHYDDGVVTCLAALATRNIHVEVE